MLSKAGDRNRDAYLRTIEGMYVDDDPLQGVIDGWTFTHPDLRIQFTVPPGYLISNGTAAVTISGPAGKAQFSGGRFTGTLDQAILSAFSRLGGNETKLAVLPPQRTTINGMEAASSTARVDTSKGSVDASVVAYRSDPQHVYYFVMLTLGGAGYGPFVSLVNSFHSISPADAAAVRPRVIAVISASPQDSVRSLAARMAYSDFRQERFLALNGLDPNSRLSSGQKLKLVVYGQRVR